ncbi:MAG: hemerythrin family protein [Fibrobacterota bacterium]|nr:MAG: hemerythrin family protein [Fibrobacterota bacterium]
MNIRLDWNETFSIGEPLLDAQHRELFDIANSLPENNDRAQVRTCVMRLFRYTREHFSAEEDYMRSVGYPNLEQHTRIHEKLIEQLSLIAQEPLGTTAADLSFKRFVLQWLTDHILICDKAIQKFVAQSAQPE